MRFSGTLLLMLALAAGLMFAAARLARTTPTEAAAERFAAHDSTAYTLPPAKLAKAVALDRTRIVLTVAASVWWLLQLWLLLGTGAIARMRDFAAGLARSRWLQCYVFLGCLLLAVALLNLPLGIYGHRVALRDGLSVQGWSSWLGDRGKLLGLEWGFGGLVAMLMFWIIRKAPTRWWFWFWIPAAACVVAGVFAAPYVLDPLFNKIEPLAQSDPALVQQLEHVAARGGISIPPQRMFLMKASAKSTELNAYVTGFGASKRAGPRGAGHGADVRCAAAVLLAGLSRGECAFAALRRGLADSVAAGLGCAGGAGAGALDAGDYRPAIHQRRQPVDRAQRRRVRAGGGAWHRRRPAGDRAAQLPGVG
jgi:hypothetical protein